MLQTAQRTAKLKSKKREPASLGEAGASTTAPSHERFLEAFRCMLLVRTLEEKLVSLYRGGQITGGVYIGKGQEAVSVACGLFLEKGDIFAPLIRDQAGRSAFGEPLIDVTRTYLGSRLGPMRGRDGNIHRGHPRNNELAMISHLGAMVSVTVGTLMAKRFKGEKNFVGLTCIGEGGMQTGSFHEGMNIAAVEQVPLVIVATNNHYAYSTSNDREFACADLVERAIGYGFEGYSLDGTDLAACLHVIGGAVKRARAGRPPQLVVASVLRLSGHGEHDDASYVPEEVKGQPFARDCLKVAEQAIAGLNLASSETLAEWRKDAAAQVDEAIATAQKESVPEAEKEDWCALFTRDLADHAGDEE
jgi:acetoin:2,6-dichlorophenolindophenol oxidoreductase subunit alpha